MKAIQNVLFLALLPILSTRGAQWDEGIDADLAGDMPVPTLEPFMANNLYPYLSKGTVMPHRGMGRSKGNRTFSGRLERRQSQCVDPTYTLACPITENLPCCPPGYPVCCHDPSDKCCATGYYCVGVETCCKTGTIACGEGCCDAGTTCCGERFCCQSGYTCQAGACVNPALSSMSVASLQSVASVSAASLSGQFVASLSSELAQQTRDGSNSDTINTAFVSPADPRIEYDPASAWEDTSSSSGVGSCNNATRVTTQANASFKFVFEGTAIALSAIPSSQGGSISISVDGESATTVNTSGGSGNQCVASDVWSRNDLPEKPHIIIVKNGLNVQGSSGGKFEFNGITYTGKGAFGTNGNPSSGNKVSPAVIGGSVGGAIGALVILGAGIIFFLHRRKKARQSAGQPATPAPTTPNQPILFSPNPGQQAPYSPPMHPGSPPMSEYNAYGGMQPQQPGAPSYQIPPSPGQSGWGGSPQQYPQQMYQDPNRPLSQGSGGAIAPLPMWVERAQAPSRDGGMSTTSATHSVPGQPPYQGGYQQGY
ncbi:hypothetical protein CPB86DRAFT_533130 [Serendipita vermifera]|nr:hypothetical protein CPB86DRAFT_533130 [Serendipita vermifera]